MQPNASRAPYPSSSPPMAAATAMTGVDGLHGVWLSGSGPTVAAWASLSGIDGVVERVRAATGADHVLGLAVDRSGVRAEVGD